MEYGGHHVYAGNRCGGNGRFHFVGPTDHDRGTCAAVVLTPFALKIVAASIGVLNPAVVGDINKDRVFSKAFLVDVIDQFADCFIEPLHHRVVTCDVRRIDFTGVFVKQSLGRIVRSVWQERRVPDEERLVASVLDEIKNRLHAFAANLEAHIAVTSAACGVAMRHAVRETASRVMALPPFTALMADVALIFQDTRQRRPLIDQGYLLRKPPRVFGRAFSFPRNGRLIAGDLVLARIQAGNHRG